MKEFIANFFDKYGLSFIMVASYFGSGSIFIASQAGVEYGYVLIWAVIGAVLLGFMAQDMSARLGIFGDTLMSFIRSKLGKKGSLTVALFLSIGCIAWTLALTAAVGKSVEILSAGAVAWQPVAVVTGILAILVGLLNYSHVEKVMTGMMFLLLALYLVVAGASQPSLIDTAAGIIPSQPDTGAMIMGAAILGTTALWPNFFLESILVKEKGWNSTKHVKIMRTDLGIGYSVGGLITLAIIIVAAAVLRPAGYTELSSFVTPGEALEIVLGQWAMIVFLIGVIAAAFNSIIPIMWTIPYMILEALDIDHKNGKSKSFKLIFSGGILLGMFSPLVSQITGLNVVEMVTLFPAYNGVFGLPLTSAFLFWAVNDRTLMNNQTNSWRLNVVNIALVLFSLYIAVNSGRGVLEAIFGGILA
jgi:Mn2+/Fe2+ NRAMP family transporter